MQKVLSKSKDTGCSPQIGSQSMVDRVVKPVNVIHSDSTTNLRTHHCTPYHCNQCGKKYFQKCHLTRHHKVHHGEKSYDCNQRSRKFIKKCDLSKHLKEHNTERSCQFNHSVKKNFKESPLTRNRKCLAERDPISVDQCGKKLMTKSYIT